LQSRYYNPDWGRFVNADDTDQLSKLGSNSDQLIDANLFAYCGNNPVNGEDQDGHWWGFIAEIGFIAALPEEVVAVAAVAVVVIAVVVVTSCVHAAIQEYRNSHVVYSDSSSSTRPENHTPKGAGRRGAFREAKRKNGIPVTEHPTSTRPAVDRKKKPIPGRDYTFGVGKNAKVIREHSGGHIFRDDPSQNRGSHFNDEHKRHYDY